MRRVIFIIVLVLFTVPLLSFSPYPSVQGIFLKDYPGLLNAHLSPQKLQALEKMVVLPNEPFNESEAKKMIMTLGNIDENILKKIANKGIYVKLFNGKLTDEPTARYLRRKTPRGYTFPWITWDDVPGLGGNRIVLVKIGHSESGKGHGSINLELHEVAHSVDRIVFDGIRSKPRFLEIWRKEASNLFPGNLYFINYPEEYFAESFAMYYYSEETRQHLKEAAPLTYQYIKKLEK
jgi:Pro-Pro endopeptidase